MNNLRLCSCGLGLTLMLASACATTTYAGPSGSDNRVSGAFQQPFRDVSMMREEPPEILKRAAAEPYSLAPAPECAAILAEIRGLDVVLGPDLDEGLAAQQSSSDAQGLTAGAILSVIGLPFRGIIRSMSGAEKREKVLAEAILSGMVRRAFLKGVARTSGCVPAAPPS